MSRPYVLRYVCLVATVLALSACQNERIQRYQSFVFGTLVEVKIRAKDREAADTASSRLFAKFDELHSTWHAWKPGALADVNRQLSSGQWFTPPASILPLLIKSKQWFKDSDELFNPAIGGLIALWGFHADELPLHPPEVEQIDAFLQELPDMDDVQIESTRVRSLNPRLSIDLGGMAKGYAIEIGMQLLHEQGISNALINAGGDLCGSGSRGDRPWRIGIRHPLRQGVLASVDLADGECVFTSGDYERGYDFQGKHYHHIIDPRNGYPANQVVSATVIHPDGALADAASTALLIAGPDGWRKVARQMDVQDVLLVDRNGRLYMTPSMQARIRLEKTDSHGRSIHSAT